MIRRLRLWLATTSVLLLMIAALSASGTNAATGYIYIAFPTWLGNCPKGGSVTIINATTGPYGELWSTPAGGDKGDDKIYAKVLFNTNNLVTYQNFCRKGILGLSSYWDAAWQVTIRPTRSGQTFWVGRLGQSHN